MYINKESTLSTITQTGANESLGMSYFSSTAWSTYSKTNNLRFRGVPFKKPRGKASSYWVSSNSSNDQIIITLTDRKYVWG